jgi:hypothetical protein
VPELPSRRTFPAIFGWQFEGELIAEITNTNVIPRKISDQMIACKIN